MNLLNYDIYNDENTPIYHDHSTVSIHRNRDIYHHNRYTPQTAVSRSKWFWYEQTTFAVPRRREKQSSSQLWFWILAK